MNWPAVLSRQFQPLPENRQQAACERASDVRIDSDVARGRLDSVAADLDEWRGELERLHVFRIRDGSRQAGKAGSAENDIPVSVNVAFVHFKDSGMAGAFASGKAM